MAPMEISKSETQTNDLDNIASISTTPGRLSFFVFNDSDIASLLEFVQKLEHALNITCTGKTIEISSKSRVPSVVDPRSIMLTEKAFLFEGRPATIGSVYVNNGQMYALCCMEPDQYILRGICEEFFKFLGFSILIPICGISSTEYHFKVTPEVVLDAPCAAMYHKIMMRLRGECRKITKPNDFYTGSLTASIFASGDKVFAKRIDSNPNFQQLHDIIVELFDQQNNQTKPKNNETIPQKGTCKHVNANGLTCQHRAMTADDMCMQHVQRIPMKEPQVNATTDQDALYNLLLTSIQQKSIAQFEFLANNFGIENNHDMLLRLARGGIIPMGCATTTKHFKTMIDRANDETLLILLRNACQA